MKLVSKEKTNDKKTTDITLGTNYDINKQLVKKYEKELTKEQLKEKDKMLLEFTRSHFDHYYMMLCHDRRDYTIFHTNYTEGSVFEELLECLQNRGKIYGIDLTEDKEALEIWLVIDDEAYCYYFFPYENAVVEY